jgi:hypothetical protein
VTVPEIVTNTVGGTTAGGTAGVTAGGTAGGTTGGTAGGTTGGTAGGTTGGTSANNKPYFQSSLTDQRVLLGTKKTYQLPIVADADSDLVTVSVKSNSGAHFISVVLSNLNL